MRRKTRRTTITLKEEHRALLHALAARRGWKGYSRIITEALDYYFAHAPEVSGVLESLLKSGGRERKKG